MLISKLRVKFYSLVEKIILGKWANIFGKTIESIEISKRDIICKSILIRESEITVYLYPEKFPLMFRRKRFFPDRKLFQVDSCVFVQEIGLVRTEDGYILLESFGSYRKLLHWNNVIPFLYGSTQHLKIEKPTYYIRHANFYHFLIEEIPAFLYAKENFRDLKVLISPQKKPSYIEEILELIFTSETKNEVKKIRGNIAVNKLVFTQRDRFSGGAHKNDIEILNRHVLPSINQPACSGDKGKIYISRQNTNKRNIHNEVEIENLLKGFCFEIVCMEQLSFREQVMKTKNADVIIGPHGAGLSHIVWNSNRKKRILEIFPSNVKNDCFASLAMTLGYEYNFFRCEDVNGKEILDTENLKRWLNKYL